MTTGQPLSERARRVCAMFGIDPQGHNEQRLARAQLGAAMIERSVTAVALVTGPSGSGKSSILAALRGRLRARGVRVVVAARTMSSRLARVRVIDALRGPVDESLRVLARAGLAQAHLAVAPIGVLSDGQRARLRIALAMDRAVRLGAWVLIDELATGLDRATASGVCITLGRWARSASLTVVAASARDDLIEPLAPDVVCDQPLQGEPTLITRKASP